MSDQTTVKSKPEVSVNSFFADTASSEETYLYDPNIVLGLDFNAEVAAKFDPKISPKNPGPGLVVRPLCVGDFDRGFLSLLGQLTDVGNVTKEDFQKRFSDMKNCNNTYYTTVIVDTNKDQIIGTASLIVEKKFIHECALRCLIEDVVVSDEYRGKQLGKLLVQTMVELGKALGCYKITLNCKDTVIKFYNGFGFVAETGNANFLIIRASHDH